VAKITAADINGLGFRAEQFGTPADFAVYLAPVIAAASGYVSGRIGADLYAQTTGDVGTSAKAAELEYATALLWYRRASFADANASQSLDDSAYLNRREYEAQGDRAHLRAESWITRALEGPSAAAGSAVALSYAETGPYAVAAQ